LPYSLHKTCTVAPWWVMRQCVKMAGNPRKLGILKISRDFRDLGHVCFPEFTFRETTFQTFLCLFVIRKVGQRKTLSGQRRTLSSQRRTLSGQRKTFSSQRKIWFSFQESVFPLAVFVFRKVVSGKPLSKLSCVCLPLEKLVNGKHFPVKGKFGLVFRKVFS
jgi:hypothetical protein